MNNEILISDLLDKLSTNQLINMGIIVRGQYGLEVINH